MTSTLILSITDGHVTFGKKTVFQSLSFNIHQGTKICLIGKNGVGKTTLMRMITGDCPLDGGERWLANDLTIGYLQQDVRHKTGQTVLDFVLEIYENEDERNLNYYKVQATLEPLGLQENDIMDNLSGGQLRRAALAKILVEEPDLLLLDEPTNHLDLQAIEWLEKYLKYYRGTILCISHDRMFLANISDQVFWLDRGVIKVCPRGFEYFEEWSTLLLEQEERELRNRQKFVDQEVAWASQGVKARRKRNVRRLEIMKREREKLKADVSSFRRMMAKIDLGTVEQEISSQNVAEFFKVSRSFTNKDGTEKKILDQFSIKIQRGDRIGILGSNGSGKSTFLKLLVGELEPDAGKIKLAKTLNFSYFDQNRSSLNHEKSLRWNLCQQGGDYVDVMGKPRHVCGYLRDFMFDPQSAEDPVKILSGGQKNRLLLAKILANPGSFLILDEPTNDLDMDTLDMLEEILSRYEGTLLVVSHDRDFLDQTVTKILAFEGDCKVEGYIGGYSDYLQSKNNNQDVDVEENVAIQKPKHKKANEKPDAPKIETKKLTYKLQYELDNLPQKIEQMEQELKAIEKSLADADLYKQQPDEFDKKSKRFAALKAELEQAEMRWLELTEMQQLSSNS